MTHYDEIAKEGDLMNTAFEILLKMINGALKTLNSKGYHLRDPLNEEFYIESVHYDPEDDEIYCNFIEVRWKRNG